MAKQSIFSAEEFKKLKPAKGGKRQKHEEKVQLKVCAHLKKFYPQLIFQCDLASGMNLGKRIGGMNTRLRSSRGLPDLFIACPKKSKFVHEGIIFTGLFIEIKKEDARRKDGTLPPAWRYEVVNGRRVRYDHHAEQQEILNRLTQLGFKAEFACGFDEAIKLIEGYLG